MAFFLPYIVPSLGAEIGFGGLRKVVVGAKGLVYCNLLARVLAAAAFLGGASPFNRDGTLLLSEAMKLNLLCNY